MPKKKLIRFAEMANFPHVIQMMTDLKGKWNSEFFHNDNEITLELACGKGEYTVNMAQFYPQRNFVGVDLKGARIWSGAKMSLNLNLKNVAFLRMPIERIADCFGKDEVSEIWITFPDPYLSQCRAKKRLTSPDFISLYRKILRPGGLIHLKTDEPNLFAYTQKVIDSSGSRLVDKIDDVYASADIPELLKIQTAYEKRHLSVNRTIRYLSFHL
ncbi:MAG: tRNA (guanosine(46)-N7)-methyltransferase TrmB [Candidatus Zixiibacteriota bacterium]